MNIDDLKRKEVGGFEGDDSYIAGYNAAIDDLHAKGLLMVWRDIESAPRDGTRILISNRENVGHAYFRLGYFHIAASNNPVPLDEILCWMPLPPLPKDNNNVDK